jgi:hypothetical protein
VRLADFILANVEPILAEWEAFARSIWPGGAAGTKTVNPAELRDHAEEILRATARDMTSQQTEAQRAEKSKGEENAGTVSAGVVRASQKHAIGRVGSGFDLKAVVAEYRALRASVLGCGATAAPIPTCATWTTSPASTSPSTSRSPRPSRVTPNRSPTPARCSLPSSVTTCATR